MGASRAPLLTGTDVVRTADLARVLTDFVEDWQRRRGIRTASASPTGAISPLQFLRERTGRSERLISQILRERTEFVSFQTADAILAAIDHVDAFHTGECPVHTVDSDGAPLLAESPAEARWPRGRARPGFKRCRGELCKGRELPATRQYFYFNKSGRDAGRPRTYCKTCERLRLKIYLRWWRRKYPEKWKPTVERKNRRRRTRYPLDGPCGVVPVAKVRFALDELVEVFGRADTAARLGISYHCLWAWLSGRRTNMHKEMATRVLRLLWEVRNDVALVANNSASSVRA